MKSKKKGFTLIELLAVITILGIVMLIAVVAVLPMITKSRNKALLDEGKSLVKAAELAYAANEDGMRGKDVCISLGYLKSKNYYEKGWDEGYVGSVLITDYGTKKFYVIADSSGTYGGSYASTESLAWIATSGYSDPTYSTSRKKGSAKTDSTTKSLDHCNISSSLAFGNYTGASSQKFDSVKIPGVNEDDKLYTIYYYDAA